MNERIRVLALQAEIKWQHQEDVIYSTMTLEQFEKFAELIVRECLTIAKNKEDELENHNRLSESNAVGIVAYRIARQFGVKE